MFRFAAGVLVGVVIARPLTGAVGRMVLPFVVEKTLTGVSRAAHFAADKLDRYSEKEGRG
ncbi:hypothetical protein SEA_BING_59 [Streptomyces phage Bing]|uniref:Uncharacterized protein n=1 Tax=Streptomyces phage Bing TaxID=2079427 RepID=A0A2L1IWB7_9CAUD|nr:hypothetical protein FDJ31_gp59 [Streptomyces phage Bing]AVD99481.1 hypothetical protein SEA_BING_59 [Streptomyces phage Bing]